jgi:Sec-independent protein translocase protein TatA
MPWVVAVFVVVLLLALIAFCITNAVRIIRDMNTTVAAFRTRLEDEANSVLEALFNAHQADNPPPPPVNGSQPTASE